MKAPLVRSLLASLHPLLQLVLLVVTNAQGPGQDINPMLTVTETSDSITISWILNEQPDFIDQVQITVSYLGPCNDAAVPSKMAVLNPPQESEHVIDGLEEFSMYRVSVTITVAARSGSASTNAHTTGTAPIQLREFRFVSATMRNITVSWEMIPCLDLNIRLEAYTLTFTPVSLPQEDPRSFEFTFDAPIFGFTGFGLTPGTEFTVTLQAMYAISDEGSLVSSVIAPSINARTFPIPGPYDLQASVGTTNITVSWQQEEPTDNLTQFNVRAEYAGPCKSSGPSFQENVPISTRVFRFESLATFGLYNITIAAVSLANQMATAGLITQTLPTAPIAGPPMFRTTHIGAFTATLAWNPIDCIHRQSEITSYILTYQATNNSVESAVIMNLASLTVIVSDLMQSTSYTLGVAGVSREGLAGPSSTITIRTDSPPPPPANLIVDSAEATSATISWTATPGFSYNVTTIYAGSCADAEIPSQTQTVSEESRVTLSNLEEFSEYSVIVATVGGRESSTISFDTLPADPSPDDDHVKYVSATDTSIVLQIPRVDCIDQNGQISEFRLSYAQSFDFAERKDLRDGVFSPGVVVIGNLVSGTGFTFQLTISTVEGGRTVVEPLIARTLGVRPSTNTPIVDTGGISPSQQGGLSTDETITTAIVLVGSFVILAIATVVLVCVLRRRGNQAQKPDTVELIERRNKRRQQAERESGSFGRQTLPAFFKEKNLEASQPPEAFNTHFSSNLSWMSALGASPTSAMYADEEGYDENDFELGGTSSSETK